MIFTKWHGCGNDFILLDCLTENPPENPGELAKKICRRHFSVGGDGLILALPSAKADFRMRIFNSDGSEPEMCGNGIRCFARYLYNSGLTDKKIFTVETGAGIITPEILTDSPVLVKVDMGEPRLAAKEIPITGLGAGPVINQPLEICAGTKYNITCVSMGNPHCVIIDVGDGECLAPLEGPTIEKHPVFPQGTNVEFINVQDTAHLKMAVWERGAGTTLACGTGACASAVAAALNNKTGRKVEVELAGGKLDIEWAENNRVYMTGPAEMVFRGSCEE